MGDEGKDQKESRSFDQSSSIFPRRKGALKQDVQEPRESHHREHAITQIERERLFCERCKYSDRAGRQ